MEFLLTAPDDFNDIFIENFLKLKFYLTFYLNKIDLSSKDFNNIIMAAHKILLKEKRIRPFSVEAYKKFSEDIDKFIYTNFEIKTYPFNLINLLFINFSINLLQKLLSLKDYLNKNKEKNMLKIKMRFSYLIKNLSVTDLIIMDKQFYNEIILNPVFNFDFKINIAHRILNYREKVIYLFDDIKKLFYSLIKNKNKLKTTIIDYENFLLYNESIVSFIETILKDELNLSRLLAVSYFILKITDHLSLLIKKIY